MPYVDLNTIHNPATGTVAPATWGDQVRDNLEFLIDPPACSVFHNTTQSLANNTFVFLACNSELFDNNAMHSTVTNNGRITAQIAGRYEFSATLSFAQPAGGPGLRFADFRVNGTTIVEGAVLPAASGNITVITVSRKIVLAATDYVELRAAQDSGASLNVTVLEFAATVRTR